MHDSSIPLALLGGVFTGLLFVLLVTCIVAGRGILPVNHFFGVRLPALMGSQAAWRGGHRAAVIPAAVAFTIALIGSGVGLVVPVASWIAIIAFTAGIIWYS
jgi:SdpI/YhfL family protein